MSEIGEGKIEEMLRLTRENNEILRSMRRRMFWSQFFSYVYWLIIIGALGWSYYFLEPYFQKYWQLYQNISTQLNSAGTSGITLPTDLKGLLDKVK